VIYFMVKQINRLRRSHVEAKEAAPPPEDVLLLREIRDSLRR
jgi:large conductance mechanosensitive channel